MVKCGEYGCQRTFRRGRSRRRHIDSEHRPLTHICIQCNKEPFLTSRALYVHTHAGHLGKKHIRQPGSIKPRKISHNWWAGLFDTRSSSQDLENSVAEKVPSLLLASCDRAVDEVIDFLQNNDPPKVTPTEVIKDGSICKGTAVTGKSGVDLVVMMKGYASVQDLRNDMTNVLDFLQKTMERCPNVYVTGRTHWAVEVELTEMGYIINADVLPAINLSIESTDSRQQMYKKMRREPSWTQRLYAPCLVPLQKKMFESIPTQLKSLIRLVKYWKKDTLRVPAVRMYLDGRLYVKEIEPRRTKWCKWPVSYALELITIDRWAKAGEPQSFDMTRALHSVLTSLKKHKRYKITLPRKMMYRETILQLDKVPYIMDPCNPFNNLYDIEGFNWNLCAAKAEEWLRSPLFKDCDRNTVYKW